MKTQKIVCALLLCSIILCSSGCATKEDSYFTDDYTSIVLNGSKYISIDLGKLEANSFGESVGKLHPEHWNIFSSSISPCYVNSEISLLYESTSYLNGKHYFCPEESYEDCIKYLSELTWSSDKTAFLFYKEKLIPEDISEIFTTYDSGDRITYTYESDCVYFNQVIQFDSTASFYKPIGYLLVRKDNSAYYFPDDKVTIQYKDDISTTEEESTQIAEELSVYKLSDEVTARLIQVIVTDGE